MRVVCIHVSCLESLVFLWLRRVYGGSCKTSFSNVSKQVVMSFCVAGVALSDIPTCLMMFRKCQNWRKPRTKCWFFYIHVSCLESLVFLWRRRVYGGSWKTSPIRMCPSRLSTLYTPHFILGNNLFFDFESCHSGPDMHVHLLSSGRSCCMILLFSCHVPECVARVPVSLWGSGG